MSLQNLLKDNNYTLYIGDAEIDTLNTTDIVAEKISAPGSNYLQMGSTIIPYSNNQTSVGTASQSFNNMYCHNLWGYNNTAVKLQEGLVIGNVNNPALTLYNQLSGSFTLGGGWTGLTDFSVTYKAVIVGKNVTMSIDVSSTQVPPSAVQPKATTNAAIILSGLNSSLNPATPKVVTIPMNVNGTHPLGAIVISAGSLTIYSSTDLNAGYITGSTASYDFPNGTEFSFSYLLS